ncbi:regulator of replication initiation timing [Rheinheimera pacifica]|uniref:hypothetical protein n=1 Tax=Rheinheimera pacifica TaxID=173990 RepID=UPI0028637415|nr:hypothetical protein [Rheinheimera pacifica]MDR6985471.1 regulator of replication initiation timing [Rheinheimera pacifica]
MKLFKALGLVILGFVVGLLSSQYFLTESTDEYNSASVKINDALQTAVTVTTQTQLTAVQRDIEQYQNILSAHKSGVTTDSYLKIELQKLKEQLKNISPVLNSVDQATKQSFQETEEKLEQLESDISFYFGG